MKKEIILKKKKLGNGFTRNYVNTEYIKNKNV